MTMQTVFNLGPAGHWQEQLAAIISLPQRAPFDENAHAFVHDFVRTLRQHSGSRQFPELAALAYWFRPTAVKQLEKHSENSAVGSKRRPRGLIFHLAPSNVDVLFAYGWLLSVLAGNTNIARLSQRTTPQRAILLETINRLARDSRHEEMLRSTLLVTYPHDEQITGEISKACDARLIWGGDATVNTIRALPLKPTAVELAFPDRYSLAAFKASSLLTLDGAALAELAKRFCNDVLWFDQQACSSPRSLFWIGSEGEAAEAQNRFWPAMHAAASSFRNEPHSLMARITDSFLLAATGNLDSVGQPMSHFPLNASGRSLSVAERKLHSGNGLLVEHRLHTLEELGPTLTDQDQTLVVYGFSEREIDQLIPRIKGRALDRIVPPGEALNFDVIWDGIDLMSILTRQIRHSPTRGHNAG